MKWKRSRTNRSDPLEDLIEAIRYNELDELKLALKAGASPTRKFPYQDNWLNVVVRPLDLACYYECSVALIEELFLAGASLNDRSEMPTLVAAALSDELDTIRLLLDRGADLSMTGENNGISALHIAQSSATIDLLLTRGADVDSRDSLARTPIMFSFGKWRFESDVVRSLINAGADLTAEDQVGRTVLHFAAGQYSTSLEYIELILDAGADVNKADNNGCTPLMIAARYHPSASDLLIQHGAHLNVVDMHNRNIIIHMLLGEREFDDKIFDKIDSTTKDTLGRDALFYSLASASEANVERLIDAGGDLFAVDTFGRTPMMTLMRHFNSKDGLSLLELLIQHGANLEGSDMEGNGPLHHALRYTVPEILDDDPYPIFEHYLYFPPIFEPGDSIMISFNGYRERVKIVQTLLAAPGGSFGIDQKNKRSETPLLVLCTDPGLRRGEKELLKILLSYNPDLYAINQDGYTAIHCLVRVSPRGRDGIDIWGIRALVSQGADINARDFEGRTPLDVLFRRGMENFSVATLVRELGGVRGRDSLEIELVEPIEKSPPLEIVNEDIYRVSIEEISDTFADNIFPDSDESELGALAEEAVIADSEISMQNRDEDAKAARLHPQASTLYKLANEAYQKDPNRKYPYIVIRSGHRPVSDQVELYRRFIEHRDCGGEEAKRANHPGKSYHNFGLAIDVVRGSDKTRLKAALEGAGWIPAVEDEGWHYEAQGVSAWPHVEKAITARVADRARDLAKLIVDFVLFRCYIRQNFDDHAAMKEQVVARRRSLAEARRRVTAARRDLNRRAADIRREGAAIDREQRSIADLRRRHASMVYDRCPNGLKYRDCKHEILRSRWREERAILLREANRRQNSLARRRREQVQAKRQWARDDQITDRDETKLRRDERDFLREKRTFDELDKKMKRWETKARQRKHSISKETSSLQTIVNEIIAESSNK